MELTARELVPSGNSLFVHNEQENVSPTCVEPNAGGRVSWLGQRHGLIVINGFCLRSLRV